jgi:hypothetical protein
LNAVARAPVNGQAETVHPLSRSRAIQVAGETSTLLAVPVRMCAATCSGPGRRCSTGCAAGGVCPPPPRPRKPDPRSRLSLEVRPCRGIL